jgi:soluble lytic murein transglycosylase-like protein
MRLAHVFALLLLVISLDSSATCYKQAAKKNRLDPMILNAMALTESSGDPKIVSKNTNATEDIGLMQINSIHLPELAERGITKEALLDGCTNLKVAASMLRRKIDKWGDNWFAVGAYHSETPRLNRKYQERVREKYALLLMK